MLNVKYRTEEMNEYGRNAFPQSYMTKQNDAS